MTPKHAAGVRLIVSFAAGLLLYAGAVPIPPSAALELDKHGAAVWTDEPRDKLGPVVRQSSGGSAQDGSGASAHRPDAGRPADNRPHDRATPLHPDWPEIVDLRLCLLAPLKFATNYVDAVRLD